jgi:hypothetical protein
VPMSWFVRIRWPFAAAFLATALVVAGCLAGPALRAAWHRHVADQQQAAFLREYGPTMKALRGIHMPAAYRTQMATQGPTGAVWWRGSAPVAIAVEDLRSALASVGATQVVVGCRQLPRLGKMCGVKATLKGRSISGHVGPRSEGQLGAYRYFGDDISLGILSDAVGIEYTK